MEFLLNFSKVFASKLFSVVFVFLLIAITQLSCNKNNDFGIEISPENQSISAFLTDTFTLNTVTILSDSIKTDELSGPSPLGNYIDPIFGEVNSSIYSHLRINNFNGFDDPNSVVVDSVVMYLVVNGYYGDLNDQIFKVEQISEDLYKDSNYYSTTEISTLNTDLSLGNIVKINPSLPGFFAGELVDDAIIRIPLDVNNFALPIINQSGSSTLDGNDGDGEFLSFFNGIKISTNNGINGGLYYIDMNSIYTKIRMFYRDTSGISTEHDTLKFDFNIDDNCAYFHHVDHNYDGTIIEDAISQTQMGQNQFYIQALGGLNSMFTIPGLNTLVEQNIIINKAEIIFPCEHYIYDEYSPSSSLFITRKNTNNEYEFLPDFFEGNFGGDYSNSSKNYSFNITRHVNEIMSEKISNDTLKVFPGGGGITANRTILNGANSINRDKAKAIITYTKY
jgi:hypothetical protein